ncbi:hypothetical protein JRQ81_008715 [Phrynocephalus forsythii]|uniref:Uncharacterized protein n=1 Tax=Phrynocephalus forsythii TaxID=171643 RepID=A0A9Q1ASK1_9SAUR|nr:hypothetical protein JRQ81_008715 [Phrynocephalus forsythii]
MPGRDKRHKLPPLASFSIPGGFHGDPITPVALNAQRSSSPDVRARQRLGREGAAFRTPPEVDVSPIARGEKGRWALQSRETGKGRRAGFLDGHEEDRPPPGFNTSNWATASPLQPIGF